MPNLSQLERALGRGKLSRQGDVGYSGWMEANDLSATEGGELNLAELRLRGEESPPKDRYDYCYCADPISYRIDRQQMLALPAEMTAIDLDGACRLTGAFNELHRDATLKLWAASPGRWYLFSERELSLHTHPLERVLAKPLQAFAVSGEDARYWQGVASEAEMLLHQQQEGHLHIRQAINGLWLWGESRVNLNPSTFIWDGVIASHPLLRGMAAQMEAEHYPFSDDLEQLLSLPVQNLLIDLDAPYYQQRRGDREQSQRGMMEIIERLLLPLVKGLQKGRYRELHLYPGNGDRLTLRARDRWRLWSNPYRPWSMTFDAD